MLNTLLAVALLFVAVLWMPLWFQLGFFLLCIFFVRKRLLLLIPAIFADVMYAPKYDILMLKMTFYVGVMIFLWWFITTKTRIGSSYVSKI